MRKRIIKKTTKVKLGSKIDLNSTKIFKKSNNQKNSIHAHELSIVKLKKELKEISDKMINLLESTSDAFFSVDKDWRYTYFNHIALKNSNKSKKELIGKKMWEVYPGVVEKTYFEIYKKVMETRQPFEFEDYMKKSMAWHEIRVFPYDDGICVYYRDITERKQLEQRKNEFISMASHELKTPITSLKLYTELLKKAQKPEQRDQFIGSMLEQINKLTKLVADLLDVSKMQVGKLEFRSEDFDLTGLVKNHIEQFKKVTLNHKVVTEIYDGSIMMKGDKDRVEQVLINLLTNAVKYSPENAQIIIRLKKDEDKAVMSVQDFGIGIDPSSKQHIFNPFFQGASKNGHTFPGLGIGLYISKIIVDHHKGSFDVESEPGKGSLFSVKFPLV